MRKFIVISGFSLIELMVVVAIIGVLTTIALPSYQGYLRRARFVEVVSATEPFKIAIALALQSGEDSAELKNGKHDIPSSPAATKNLAKIDVKNGIITAIASDNLSHATYILKPNEDGSTWNIDGTCIKLGLCHAA